MSDEKCQTSEISMRRIVTAILGYQYRFEADDGDALHVRQRNEYTEFHPLSFLSHLLDRIEKIISIRDLAAYTM